MVITDRRRTGGRPLEEVVAASLEGGARLVQLREKDLGGRELLRLAQRLVGLAARFGAKVLVNDRIDVALAAEADGVVLPADSFPTGAARQLLGPSRLLGRSTHSPQEVEQAAAEGCDFALFGPVFSTPEKERYGPPQGLQRLALAARTRLPVYAVGGIGAANVAAALAAGAHGIAAIRAIMAATDPAAAVARLLEASQRPAMG
jgi:thiamine-phosphate pyrophosphorylase